MRRKTDLFDWLIKTPPGISGKVDNWIAENEVQWWHLSRDFPTKYLRHYHIIRQAFPRGRRAHLRDARVQTAANGSLNRRGNRASSWFHAGTLRPTLAVWRGYGHHDEHHLGAAMQNDEILGTGAMSSESLSVYSMASECRNDQEVALVASRWKLRKTVAWIKSRRAWT
jgi:hypothetical protein